MDKIKIPHIILLVTCVFAAFLCGLFIGRNEGGQTLYQMPVSTVPSPTQASPTTEETLPEASAEASTETPTEAVIRKVNVNTASARELMSLPGIGEVLAQRIIAYRLENGHYQVPTDLLKVEGIGEKLLEKITPYITMR